MANPERYRVRTSYGPRWTCSTAIYHRTQRRLRDGWPVEQALDLEPRAERRGAKCARTVEVVGTVYPSVAAAALGLGYEGKLDTVYQRLDAGWPAARAFGIASLPVVEDADAGLDIVTPISPEEFRRAPARTPSPASGWRGGKFRY